MSKKKSKSKGKAPKGVYGALCQRQREEQIAREQNQKEIRRKELITKQQQKQQRKEFLREEQIAREILREQQKPLQLEIEKKREEIIRKELIAEEQQKQQLALRIDSESTNSFTEYFNWKSSLSIHSGVEPEVKSFWCQDLQPIKDERILAVWALNQLNALQTDGRILFPAQLIIQSIESWFKIPDRFFEFSRSVNASVKSADEVAEKALESASIAQDVVESAKIMADKCALNSGGIEGYKGEIFRRADGVVVRQGLGVQETNQYPDVEGFMSRLRYYGQWDDNKKEGYGVESCIFDVNNTQVDDQCWYGTYEGSFSNNKPEYGRQVSPELGYNLESLVDALSPGAIYLGKFTDMHDYSGFGVRIEKNVVYQGQFSRGERKVGFGKMTKLGCVFRDVEFRNLSLVSLEGDFGSVPLTSIFGALERHLMYPGHGDYGDRNFREVTTDPERGSYEGSMTEEEESHYVFWYERSGVGKASYEDGSTYTGVWSADMRRKNESDFLKNHWYQQKKIVSKLAMKDGTVTLFDPPPEPQYNLDYDSDRDYYSDHYYDRY